jgi:serine beta-lactamase-like protein LACTB, mitochondrial
LNSVFESPAKTSAGINFFLGVLLAALLSGCVHTPSVEYPGAQALDQTIEAERKRQGVVGLAVGIIRAGKIIYLKGYGLADRENGTQVSTNTLFRWASISKPVTAIAAMQLMEQGKLGLEDDVRKYVPEFTEHGSKVTIRQLMCHQGGIVHYSNGPVVRTPRQYDQPHPYADVTLALDTFKDSPLVNQPGEKFAYSTHGYILLSAAVQRAGGAAFFDQVQTRINQPLGGLLIKPDYQWLDLSDRAVGYRRIGGKVVRDTDTDVSWKLGGGGFISRIGDLAGFATGLINGSLISKESEKLMWTRQSTATGESKYGLGFTVEEQNGTLKISHNGSQEKARTRMVIYPEQKHGIVVMCNSRFADPARFSTAAYRALSTSVALNSD